MYNELCTEEYESKLNHTEIEFWDIWGEVYEELHEMFTR